MQRATDMIVLASRRLGIYRGNEQTRKCDLSTVFLISISSLYLMNLLILEKYMSDNSLFKVLYLGESKMAA